MGPSDARRLRARRGGRRSDASSGKKLSTSESITFVEHERGARSTVRRPDTTLPMRSMEGGAVVGVQREGRHPTSGSDLDEAVASRVGAEDDELDVVRRSHRSSGAGRSARRPRERAGGYRRASRRSARSAGPGLQHVEPEERHSKSDGGAERCVVRCRRAGPEASTTKRRGPAPDEYAVHPEPVVTSGLCLGHGMPPASRCTATMARTSGTPATHIAAGDGIARPPGLTTAGSLGRGRRRPRSDVRPRSTARRSTVAEPV